VVRRGDDAPDTLTLRRASALLAIAIVAASSLKQRATSGADGTFRFDDLKPSTYRASARKRVSPTTSKVKVGDEGTERCSWRYRLQNFSGAEISVLASDRRSVSDSTGSLFIELTPVRYMVRVRRPDFAPRLVSVTIPNDSGRRMVVWLTPSSRGASAREEFALDRLVYRSVVLRPAFVRSAGVARSKAGPSNEPCV